MCAGSRLVWRGVPSRTQRRWLSTVRPGQQITLGVRNDLLAVFDTEPFELALREAEATSKLRAEEVRQREFARDKAKADLDRAFKAMRGDELDERIFTREQVDNLRLAVDTAEVDRRVAELEPTAGATLRAARPPRSPGVPRDRADRRRDRHASRETV